MDALKIQIAATFTGEPVTRSLEFLLGMLRVPAQIGLAPFNQGFQELLDPGSASAQNHHGINILLVPLEDLAGGSGSGNLATNSRELGRESHHRLLESQLATAPHAAEHDAAELLSETGKPIILGHFSP